MPNQQAQQNLHSENYYLSFPDGSFSKNFLDFAYQNEEQWTDERLVTEIKQKVYKFPEELSPHYYQGKQTPADFRNYATTDEGKKTIKELRKELDTCFKQLNAWAKEQKLEVSGAEHTTQSVDAALLEFYNRLINGDFSDRTILFYTDGKKSIETLTLLIQDASIDLAFRQNQLINLVAEGNLLLCADGCFSRFMAAADALKNFGDLSFSSLVKKFVLDLAEKTGRGLFEDRVNYSVALCEKLNISPAGNEIHAKNYLINRLFSELGLLTLIVKDDFVRLFENNNPEIRQAIDNIYQKFQKNFKNEFRADHLVQFIIEQYYQKENIHFSSGVFSSSKELDTKALENFLKVMGEDSDFSLHEILDFDEAGKILLKEETALVVTLTERLLNKGWFDLDQNGRLADKYRILKETFNEFNIAISPQSKRDQSIRIFSGNLALSWITDEEGNRMTLPYCLEKITNCLSLLREKLSANMLKNLLENSEDFIDFFAKLPREEHENALDWLAEKEFNLHTSMFSTLYLYKHLEPNNRLFWENQLIKDFNKLFVTLSSDARANFIQRFNLHDKVSELLSISLEQIKFIGSENFALSIVKFIQFIKESGFRNFENLYFDTAYTKINGLENNYLTNIDFSNTNFKDTEFHTVVYFSTFKGATLKNLVFYNNIFGVDFKESKGTIVIFGDVSNTDFSRSHLTADFEGEIQDSLFHELTGNIRVNGNIDNSDVTNFQGDFKLNGNVIKTNFKDFAGAMEINGVLSESNFENAHGTSLEINGELGGCNLHAIQFEKIKVTGKISNSYLTSIDFTDTIFIDRNSKTELANLDKVFKVEFQFDKNENGEFEAFFKDSQFSTDSLIRFLKLPSMNVFTVGDQKFPLLRGTDLSEVDFQSAALRTALKKFKLLDFNGANLQSSNFDHFLQNETPFLYQLNFENANLKGSTFDGANLFNCYLQGADLSDCDLSTANIEYAGVQGAKIDNLTLNCEQLFHFYEQGHRDFSTLRLVGKLKNTETRSLAGAKLSSEVFEYLIEQGFKNFNEVDLMAVSAEILSKYDGRDDLSFKKTAKSSRRASTVIGCVKKSRLNKRDITCLINSDDLESFNTEINDPQNLEKIKIDSERFLAVVKSASAEKQAQLIELASLRPIVGPKKVEVKKLQKFGQWQIHLKKVGQVAGLMSKGLMLKSSLVSFLNGDYTDTAINLGFVGGGPFLAHFSKELESLGDAFLFEGKNLLGNGFKAASPFFKRSPSAFMVYDLVQGIKALNSGDKDAVVRVIGDSIYIGVDVAEVGIEIAEVFEIFEGVSAITGPIGEVIGAVVFLGTDIYQAVERVKHIDEMIHLTGDENFREGVRAFLGMGIEDYLEELIEEKQFNEAVIKQKFEFLKQHPTIKNYLFPVETQVCHKERYLEGAKWQGGKGRWRLTEVCDQTKPVLHNQIFLEEPKEQRTFSRAKPEVPGVDLLCFPAGSGSSTGLSYSCENAIGIADPSQKAGNDTLIEVGEGEDRVYGFLDSPNIIVAGNGDKKLIGGNQNDSFILQGDLISGLVDGKEGVNTLDLGEFALNRGSLQINLNERDPYLVHEGYGFKVFKLWRMQQMLARKDRPETIHVGCNTSYVDGRGGYNSYAKDVIVIGNNPDCHYQMQIKVAPYTLINNQASQGNFSYSVIPGSGESEIYFEPLGKDTTQHQISFNYTLEEIKRVRLSDNKVIFNLSKAGNEFNVTLNRLNSTKISSVFMDAEVKLGDKRTYTLQQTEKAPAEIVRQYPALAEKLQGSLVIQARNQTVVIGYPFHHDVLQNDPLQPSHLVGNGGENIYRIEPGANNQKILKVTVYPPPANSTQVETLDVRPVINKLEANPNCTALLKIRKKANNLYLIVKPKKNKRCKFRKNIATIMLKDAAKANRTSRFNIIAHQSFLEINNTWSLVPKPLEFDETKKIIVLSAEDIEAHTRVMLPKMPGGCAFARTGEDLQDLVITSNRIKQARTVLIKDFYSAQGRDAQKLLSLSLQFGNETVNLSKLANRSLPSLTTLQNNKKERVYNSIFGKTISDATTIQSAASKGMLLGLALVPIAVVGYFVRRHVLGRQARPVVEAAALLAAATFPQQAEAKPIILNTEMVACHNKLLEDKHCAKSQTSIGALIFCANNEMGFAWFKGENGYDSAYAFSNSTRQDAFELRTFGENLFIARGADKCQQFINLKEMHEIPAGVMAAQPIFEELLKRPLEQYRKQNNPIERFKQQAQQISLVYLGECLAHTRLGDSFQVLGLTPNWQQRDVGHWSSRMLRSLSVNNLFSSASISAVCLETALIHPRVQSALPQDAYRSKLVIRFIADLLQFGPTASSCIPALVDFLCYQHPRSYEIAMGLRASLALLEMMNDPSSWYLAVGLFILPQLPYLLENMGIPVTRCISHILEMLERFLIPYSLLLSVQEDPQRLEASEHALQQADQRVSKGQERVLAVYRSGIGFFSKPKVSEDKTNDAEFSHGASTQFAAKN